MSKPKAEFWQLPKPALGAFFLCAGFTLFLAYDQSYWWNLRADYVFGYIVPVFVAAVVHDRWDKIKGVLLAGKTGAPAAGAPKTVMAAPRWAEPAAAAAAAGMLFAGLLLILFGALYRASQGAQIPASFLLAAGYCGVLLGAVYLFSDRDSRGRPVPFAARVSLVLMFVFPAFIWFISTPMLDFVEGRVSLFLLNKVTAVVFFFFDILGAPLERQGNILLMPSGQVGVEDACSGIRSLTACIFAGSFLGAFCLGRFWKKVFLVLMAMVFAFIMNIARSLFLSVWAYNYGPETINGDVHDITGYAVLGVTFLGLVGLLPLLNMKFEWGELPRDETDKSGADASGDKKTDP